MNLHGAAGYADGEARAVDARRVATGRWLLAGAVLAVALLLLLWFAPAFFKPSNLANVLRQATPLGIVALGQAMVLLVRGIDLSVASVMATAAVIATAFRSTDDRMMPLIFVACLAFGAFVGAVNGLLVTKRKVSPFLATLAVMIVLQGIRFAYTGGSNSGTLPPGFRDIGRGDFLGVPLNAYVLFVLAVGLSFVLHRTVFGRRIYLVGGSPEGAHLVGVNSDRVTIACYVTCSTLAAVAGLLLVGYVGLVDNWTGRGYELDSIVAAVIGGVAVTGGKGTLFGALIGTAVLMIVFNLVVVLGLPVELQHIIKGVVIVCAAAFYVARQQRPKPARP